MGTFSCHLRSVHPTRNQTARLGSPAHSGVQTSPLPTARARASRRRAHHRALPWRSPRALPTSARPASFSPFPAPTTPSLLPEDSPVPTSPLSPAPLPDAGPPARCPNHAHAHIHARTIRTTARATHQTTPEPCPAHAPAPAQSHANDGDSSATPAQWPRPSPPSCPAVPPQAHPDLLCRCDGTGSINNHHRRRRCSAACVRVRTCGVCYPRRRQAGGEATRAGRHASKCQACFSRPVRRIGPRSCVSVERPAPRRVLLRCVSSSAQRQGAQDDLRPPQAGVQILTERSSPRRAVI